MLFFVAAQLGLAVAMEQWRPELRDLEYGAKRTRLQARLAENPGRPLLLLLGSSRANLGIHPGALPPLPAVRPPRGGPPAEPLVFNASLMGAGPLIELLCLRRLLDEGFRPDWVILECWPANWDQGGDNSEFPRLVVSRLSSADVRLLRRYHPQPADLCREWCLARATPWSSSRFALLMQYARDSLPKEKHRDDMWQHIDPWGWLPYQGSADPKDIAVRLTRTRDQFAPLLHDFRITPTTDRAWHDLLALCRQEGIAATLLYMPESKVFGSWYPPAVRAETDRYLRRLSRECRVSLVDARDWCPDEDFADGFHLLPPAADRFSERLGREGLPGVWRERPAMPQTAKP
jgi:hypothetical protein